MPLISLFTKEKKKTLAILIFLLALLPRVIGLADHSLTVDEPRWMERGENLIKDLFRPMNLIFGVHLSRHPGIPAAFLIGLFKLSFSKILGPITASRLPIAILGALNCLVLFWLGRQIFSFESAIFSALFLAFSPFHIALSRIAHLDLCLTFFFSLSLLSYLVFVQKKEKKYLYLSGISFGLALLTKIFALIILPIIGLSKLIWGLLKRKKITQIFNKKEEGVCLILGLIIFFLGYPLLWWDFFPSIFPKPTFNFIEYFLHCFKAGLGGHFSYFLGQVTSHPSRWFYLFVLFARTNEILLIFVILGLILLLYRLNKPNQELKDFILFFWLVIYISVMTFFSKMGDRYLLPIWPVLAILAGQSLLFLLYLFFKPFKYFAGLFVGLEKNTIVFLVGIALILSLSLPNIFNFFPNYYLYYNLFWGGPLKAQKVFQIGLGEGHKEAFEYLAEKTNHQAKVALLGYDNVTRFYYQGPLIEVKKNNQEWKKADYLVLNILKVQRYPNWSVVKYAQTHQPEYTVVLNGLPVMWIYRLK